MLLNARRKKDGRWISQCIYALYIPPCACLICCSVPVIANQAPGCQKPSSQGQRQPLGLEGLNGSARMTTGCHCLTERNLGRLKTSYACLPEDADFILKSSSPSGLSLDGVLRDNSEWDASVLSGVWKMLSFFNKKHQRQLNENEKNNVISEHLRNAVLLKFVNYIYLLAS